MYILSKNWCIKLDAENRDVVIKYFKDKDYCIDGYINRYYGVLFNNFANEDTRWVQN